MYSSEHYYRLAKTRRAEIMREAAADRLFRSIKHKPAQKPSPRVAWALVGPAFAVVLLSLIA